jgi:hypothetical protein
MSAPTGPGEPSEPPLDDIFDLPPGPVPPYLIFDGDPIAISEFELGPEERICQHCWLVHAKPWDAECTEAW